MYCYNCGKEIDDKAVICVGCGVPVVPKEKTIPVLPVVNDMHSNKKMSGWIIASIVLLSLCILSNISMVIKLGGSFGYAVGSLITVILPLLFIIVDFNKSSFNVNGVRILKKEMSGWTIASIVLLSLCILSNIGLGIEAGLSIAYIVGSLMTVILPLIFIIVDFNKSKVINSNSTSQKDFDEKQNAIIVQKSNEADANNTTANTAQKKVAVQEKCDYLKRPSMIFSTDNSIVSILAIVSACLSLLFAYITSSTKSGVVAILAIISAGAGLILGILSLVKWKKIQKETGDIFCLLAFVAFCLLFVWTLAILIPMFF